MPTRCSIIFRRDVSMYENWSPHGGARGGDAFHMNNVESCTISGGIVLGHLMQSDFPCPKGMTLFEGADWLAVCLFLGSQPSSLTLKEN
ncbi:hypothetical protein SLE2022_116010 [Rubroshorea leprosula]